MSGRIPGPLQDGLGDAGALALMELLNTTGDAWRDEVLTIAGDRFDDLELNVLVQIVVVDGDTEAVIADLATRFGVAPSALRGSPLLLIGSEAELIDKLLALRERLGLSYFVVFDAALESFAPIVAGLAGR